MSHSDERMEALYIKLYNKYNTLKGEKFSKLAGKVSENDIVQLVTDFDAYVNDLRGENQKLLAAIDELRNEVCSLRFGKSQKYEDIQILSSEERQKNEQLTKETDTPQETSARKRSSRRLSNADEQLTKEIDTPQETSARKLMSRRLSNADEQLIKEIDTPQDTSARKRRRPSGGVSDNVPTESVRSKTRQSKVSESPVPFAKENICNVDNQEPQCIFAGSSNCLFQSLVECFTGMKVSITRQSDGGGICALHQSSGYSFELTWVKNAGTGETELMYQVSSLGTFERIAPEWMRETIMFSMNMCPSFFARVSRVIKFAR